MEEKNKELPCRGDKEKCVGKECYLYERVTSLLALNFALSKSEGK